MFTQPLVYQCVLSQRHYKRPCAPPGSQGQASHALWVSWALMEAQQGDATAVRYLFKRGLDVGPRSRCRSVVTLQDCCVVSGSTLGIL